MLQSKPIIINEILAFLNATLNKDYLDLTKNHFDLSLKRLPQEKRATKLNVHKNHLTGNSVIDLPLNYQHKTVGMKTQ